MAWTKRDIRQRVKVNSEDIAHYGAGWVSFQLSDQDFLDKLQGNTEQIIADLQAYPDAEP